MRSGKFVADLRASSGGVRDETPRRGWANATGSQRRTNGTKCGAQWDSERRRGALIRPMQSGNNVSRRKENQDLVSGPLMASNVHPIFGRRALGPVGSPALGCSDSPSGEPRAASEAHRTFGSTLLTPLRFGPGVPGPASGDAVLSSD